MSIYPDFAMILYQAIPFALVMFILHKLVFKPFSAYLEERDRATVGAREEAERLSQDAGTRMEEYESRLEVARAEAGSIRAERRKVALSVRQAALDEARAEAEERVAEALEVISGEEALAAQELRRMANRLSEDISARVLGGSPMSGGAPAGATHQE